MDKVQRLDQALVIKGLASTRSQAANYIKLGYVRVNSRQIKKTSFRTLDSDVLELDIAIRYVSRAALKLASVAKDLLLNFDHKVVLDVGSSTGGFTDFALRHGAQKVIAVDVGTNQLHPSLKDNPHVELHEKTDIRQFQTKEKIDLVVADVSFISLREVLPSISKLSSKTTEIVVMVKPQFEAVANNLKHKGVIKNDTLRRQILKDFESWVVHSFVILKKSDSSVSGSKGNVERFYKLRKISAPNS